MVTSLEPRRSFFDRIASLATAKPDATFTPPPTAIADGMWALERRSSVILGITLPCRSTLIRLASGGLLVHSPPPLDQAARAALEQLGPVTAVIAPNSLHHSYVPENAMAFPGAQVFLAPGLAERIAKLPQGATLSDEPDARWRDEIEQFVIRPDPGGLSEVTFFHRPSKTVILTDFSMNLVRAHTRRQAAYWRVAGYPAAFGPSRIVRMTAFRDRRVAVTYASRVLQWDFERIVMCHGEIVERGGREVFRAAFSKYLDDRQR